MFWRGELAVKRLPSQAVESGWTADKVQELALFPYSGATRRERKKQAFGK